MISMPIYASTYKVYLNSKRKSEEELNKVTNQKNKLKNIPKNSHKTYRNKH